MTTVPSTRRNGLVLAGGGVKVAFQAGVLGVLLGERGIPFTHVNASSSGVLNALLMAKHRGDGRAIADEWRRTRPTRGMAVNWQALRPFKGTSLLKNTRLLENIVKKDWRAFPVRDEARRYKFYAYNLTEEKVHSFPLDELDDDKLLACIALPRWFPPVVLDRSTGGGRDTWVDAVFASDSNAASLGSVDPPLDDIWVIWTVDITGQPTQGWRAYFRVLEMAAAAAYRREREHLIDQGFVPAAQALKAKVRPPHVLFEIAADVPVHYLFTFFRRHVQQAVHQGEQVARNYLTTYRRLLEVTP